MTKILISNDAADQAVELDKMIEKITVAYCRKRTKTHCEMKIPGRYVSRLGLHDMHPISYICVSKLACMCWTVINAWNEKHDKPQFVWFVVGWLKADVGRTL